MATPSWQDIFDIGQYTLQSRRPKLVVNRGDVTDAILAGGASMVDVGIGEAAIETRSTFLDGADGNRLTVEARDRGVERDAGDPSVGTVTFSRPTAAAGGGTLPAGFLVGSVPDLNGGSSSYTLDSDVVFAGGDLSKLGNVTCTRIGPEGNAGAGTVTRMLGTAFDSTIAVTNAALFVGGSNPESDPDLRDRTRGFFLTQARGTEEAVIYGAKTVRQVKRATLIVDPTTAVGTLYVSDADGNANAAMVAKVEAVLPKWISYDSICNVVGATVSLQAIDFSLTVRANASIEPLIDRVRKAIVAQMNRLNPGETLVREALSTAGMRVDASAITKVRINVPAADIVPAANVQLRTTISLITSS